LIKGDGAGFESMTITLIRHGRPSYQLKGRVKARDLPSIADCYDAAGIIDTPPTATLSAISGHDIVVCSHLKRSHESAGALGIKEIHISDPLFAECAIPHFSNGSIVLPLGVWIGVLRVLWLLGFASNGESLSRALDRADEAARELIVLARGEKHVVLIGHGLFNSLIARVLLHNGWSGPKRPGKDYWGFGTYLPANPT
jgi:broad specificity phosphatase PhoE